MKMSKMFNLIIVMYLLLFFCNEAAQPKYFTQLNLYKQSDNEHLES